MYQLAHGCGVVLVFISSILLASQQPTYVEYLAMAGAAVQQQQLAVALHWYQQARTVAPMAVTPRLGVAQVYRYRGNTLAAAYQVSVALQIDPRSAAAWRLWGDIASDRSDNEQVLRARQQLFMLAPSPTTAVPLALQSLAMGRAADVPALMLTLTATTPTLTILQGIAALHQSASQQAQHFFDGSGPAAPYLSFFEVAQGWQGCRTDVATLGLADLQQGWYWLARNALQAALTMNEPSVCQQQSSLALPPADIHAIYAWSLWQTGATAAALAQLAVAPPTDALGVLLAATIALEQGQAAVAEVLMTDWYQHHAPTAAVLWLLGQAATANYQLTVAEDSWWKLFTLTTVNDQAAVFTQLFRLYETSTLGRTNGRYNQLAALALPIADAYPILLDHLATWALEQYHITVAQGYLQRAVLRAPYSAVLRLHLGRLYYTLGNLTAAAMQLTTAVDLTSAGTTCKEATILLRSLSTAPLPVCMPT